MASASAFAEEVFDSNDLWNDVNRQHCTYDQGACTQVIYVCVTCGNKTQDDQVNQHPDQESMISQSESSEADAQQTVVHPNAVCEQCAELCHAGHTLVDIDLKHRIRCDCGVHGTPLEHIACNWPSKDKQKVPQIHCNLYDRNFKLRFCIEGKCLRNNLYYKNEDEMLQCCCCTDWVHTLPKCVGDDFECIEATDDAEAPPFVCRACMIKPENAFLLPYIVPANASASPDLAEAVDRDAKRRRVFEGNESASTSTSTAPSSPIRPPSCKRPTHFVSSSELKHRYAPRDFFDSLCDCQACMPLFKTAALLHLVVHDEFNAQARDISDTEELSSLLGSLPATIAHTLVAKWSLFRRSLHRQIAALYAAQPGAIVDGALMKDMVSEASREAGDGDFSTVSSTDVPPDPLPE